MNVSPTTLKRALAIGNSLAAMVDAVRLKHGESFKAQADDELVAWRVMEKRLREHLPPPIQRVSKGAKRWQQLSRIKPGTDESIFVELQPSDTPEKAARRIRQGAIYYKVRIHTMFTTHQGKPGIRVWRIT